MPQTALSNTFICQPQQRNMHGRMFGGFLMRRVTEFWVLGVNYIPLPVDCIINITQTRDYAPSVCTHAHPCFILPMLEDVPCLLPCPHLQQALGTAPVALQICRCRCRRRAFELAFSTTYMFAGSRPEFLLVDEVTFQHPVCAWAPDAHHFVVFAGKAGCGPCYMSLSCAAVPLGDTAQGYEYENMRYAAKPSHLLLNSQTRCKTLVFCLPILAPATKLSQLLPGPRTCCQNPRACCQTLVPHGEPWHLACRLTSGTCCASAALWCTQPSQWLRPQKCGFHSCDERCVLMPLAVTCAWVSGTALLPGTEVRGLGWNRALGLGLKGSDDEVSFRMWVMKESSRIELSLRCTSRDAVCMAESP